MPNKICDFADVPVDFRVPSRRGVLRLAPWMLTLAQTNAAKPGRQLISHRGVFSERVAENSAAAIEEALRRGYSMVEIDIRRSADGRAVISHDDRLRRVFGVDKAIADLSWDELRKLRTTAGGQPMLELRDVADLVRNKAGLWLDIKDNDLSPEFLQQVERVIVNAALADRTIVGIHPLATSFFYPRLTTARSIQTLFYEFERGQIDLRKIALVEGLGFSLSDESVQWGLDHKIPVIPFVGLGHFPTKERMARSKAVVTRLRQAGVTTFMIDSSLEPIFAK